MESDPFLRISCNAIQAVAIFVAAAAYVGTLYVGVKVVSRIPLPD